MGNSHTFDRRSENAISDMRRAHKLGLPNTTTVQCLSCKKYITQDNLDETCEDAEHEQKRKDRKSNPTNYRQENPSALK